MREGLGPGARGHPPGHFPQQANTSRTQRITLVRNSAGYGFSIRGGAEHKLGIYVSEVEKGSEAHLQGLQVGDQILKVCGMPVGQSTHREVVAVIQSRSRVQLKVRSGGLIPVRNRRSEPLSWRVVTQSERGNSGVTELVRRQVEKAESSPKLIQSRSGSGEETEQCTEQRLQISLQGQQGLGCSICKGPVEKPGIFIQSTKAGRLAREVGLRPGDQIIECNGASFRNIEFGDAVFHLKSSRKLELLVRKGAGLELFPSESSGYDSSASSSVGDSPASNSSVASEKDRSDQSEAGVDVNHNTVVKPPKLPRPPDPPPARVPTPQNTNNHEAERRKLQAEQDRLRRESEALSEERRKFEEEKRLLRSSIGSRSNLVGSKSISNLAELHLPPSPKTHNMPSSPHTHISKSPSASSTVSGDSSSSSSSSSGGSLAAALQSEIKRRAQKATTGEKGSLGRAADSKSGTDALAGRKAPYITEKNEKHDLLIAEFKKAHQKMFSSSPEVSEEEDRVSMAPPAPPKPTDKAPTSGLQKPKAPPPPPKSSVSSISSSSSPSPRPSLSTFKPVVSPRSSSLTSRSLVTTPGIPTPDYDITPDRSPHGHRKLFTKHKVSGGKHIMPPTIESIHRAKSLSSLVEVGSEVHEQRSRGRTQVPGSLKPALSQTALNHHTSPSLSSLSRHSGQYRSSGALYEAAARKEAVLLDRLSPGPPSISSRLSSNQPEFSKRHPDTTDHQLESFQVDIVKPPVEVKPPPIYFEKSSSSNYAADTTEQHRFEFLPRPCDPTTIPAKEDGEEARIASKDYRAVNATLGKALEKTRFNKVEVKKPKELGESKITVRSFGLKKAPAPMPPILRK